MWLALALVAAPQLSYLHALTHHGSADVHQAGGDDRQQAPDKACEVCLTLAHLGQALASQHGWAVMAAETVLPGITAIASAAQRPPAHFQARAPPVFL